MERLAAVFLMDDNHTKVRNLSKRAGHICIQCPNCREEQDLPLSDEWYSVDLRGNVSPIFVCMAQKDGHYRCHYEGDLQVINL